MTGEEPFIADSIEKEHESSHQGIERDDSKQTEAKNISQTRRKQASFENEFKNQVSFDIEDKTWLFTTLKT